MKNIFEIIQAPFRYDDYGQMIFDKNNNIIVNVRMWGQLQNEENAEELQDGFGNMLAETLNNISQQQLGNRSEAYIHSKKTEEEKIDALKSIIDKCLNQIPTGAARDFIIEDLMEINK
jgi:hypothetical protein